jgi:hypothetical protein
LSSEMLHRVAWQILTSISEHIMMEAVRTSEMSFNIYQTTGCNIPRDSHLHGRNYCRLHNTVDKSFFDRSSLNLHCSGQKKYLFSIPARWARGYNKENRSVDGGSKNLWNVGKVLPDYTALQTRRLSLLFLFYWLFVIFSCK